METAGGHAEVVAATLGWPSAGAGTVGSPSWSAPGGRAWSRSRVPGALALGARRMGPESGGLRQGASRSSCGGHYYTFITCNLSLIFFFKFLQCFALQQPGIVIHISAPSSASLPSAAPPLLATTELQTGLPV